VGVEVGVAVGVAVGVGVGVVVAWPKFQGLAVEVRTTISMLSPISVRLSTQGSGVALAPVQVATSVPALKTSMASGSRPAIEECKSNTRIKGSSAVAEGAVISTC